MSSKELIGAKVLHVIGHLAPRYGGPTLVCLDMAKYLSYSGMDVTVFATNRDYPSGTLDVPIDCETPQDGYKVHYFSVQFTPYLFSLDFARALQKNISHYDLVHIHGIYRFPQSIAAYFARKHGIPYVITPHGALDPFLYHQKRNRKIKRLHEHIIDFPNLNNASAIHYTAEDEKYLVEPLKLKGPPIVVPNGIDIEKYQYLPGKGFLRDRYKIGNGKIILHLGRINFKKGLDILVNAFAKIQREMHDTWLVLAGPDNDDYAKRVKTWVNELGIGKRTIFTGMLNGEEVKKSLVDADILALPSYTENFGIAVIEALACQLPVVISDKVNIWREVKEGGAGLVTACDDGEVAAALKELLLDDEKRKSMGANGRVLVSTRYDWQIVIDQLIQEYQRIIGKC